VDVVGHDPGPPVPARRIQSKHRDVRLSHLRSLRMAPPAPSAAISSPSRLSKHSASLPLEVQIEREAIRLSLDWQERGFKLYSCGTTPPPC
jgi:hypothetical protein